MRGLRGQAGRTGERVLHGQPRGRVTRQRLAEFIRGRESRELNLAPDLARGVGLEDGLVDGVGDDIVVLRLVALHRPLEDGQLLGELIHAARKGEPQDVRQLGHLRRTFTRFLAPHQKTPRLQPVQVFDVHEHLHAGAAQRLREEVGHHPRAALLVGRQASHGQRLRPGLRGVHRCQQILGGRPE